LFLVVGGVFLPLLRNGFVEWDDYISVYKNPRVQGLDAKRLAWMFTDVEYTLRYKPLTWLSYALIHAAGGLNPFGYHLAGLLCHGMNTVLVFVVLRGLLAASRGGNETGPLPGELSLFAGLGALLWAVDPLRVEAVARVTDLQYCQSLWFTLISFWCYLRAVAAAKGTAVRKSWFWCSVAAFALAMLSYPFVFSYAVVLVVVDVYPLRRLPRGAGAWCSAAARRIWLEKLPFALLGGLVLITFYKRLHATGWMADAKVVESLPVRLQFGLVGEAMQAFYVWAYYLWKPWVPFDLSPVYTTLVEFKPLAWLFVLSATGVIGLTVLLVWKRRQWPGALALWICHLVLLVPALGLTQHPHYTGDRYSYVPGILWSVLLAGVPLKWCSRPRARVQVFGAGVAVAVIMSVASFQQAGIWRNNITLFSYMIAKLGNDPYRSDIYWRLGRAYADQGRLDEAIGLYQQALGLNPNCADAHSNLGLALGRKGKTDEAIRQFQETLRLRPFDADVWNDLGLTLGQKGQTDEAIRQFREAIRLKPGHAEAHNNLGNALALEGQTDEAIRQIQEALRLNQQAMRLGPDVAQSHNNLGIALAMKGEIAQAIREFQAALRLKSNNAEAHYNLGRALDLQGQTNEAIVQFETTVRLKPDHADAHNNLGLALARRGKIAEAVGQYQETLRLKPDHAEAHNNLGIAFYQQGRVDEAIREFQEALRLRPDFVGARKNLDIVLATRARPAPPPADATNP
jgi:tetratricopeptide (TPR) repeat protein